MNIESAVMKVDYWKAREQYDAYKALVTAKRATPDDIALTRALWQIRRGAKVIDINQAIVLGGVDAHGLPKLAIGRAHWPNVFCTTSGGRFVFSGSSERWTTSGRQQWLARALKVRHPDARNGVNGTAQTPLVPPQHRPKGALSGYHILWEAVWERRPPGDPLLLRHVDGPFYVVLAQWDLSPLEQAVLRAKL